MTSAPIEPGPIEPGPTEPGPTEPGAVPPSARREVALVLVTMAAAGGVAILAASQTWETVRISRVRPLADLVLKIAGRKIEAAVTPLAIVVLAAILAIFAFGALARRVLGGVVALTGCALAWRGIAASSGMGDVNVSSLLDDRAHAVGVVADSYATSPMRGWPLLVAVSGAVIVLCGVAVVRRGARWPGMSSKYDAPARTAGTDRHDSVVAASVNEPLPDDAAWRRLDRGEDPTLPSL